MSGRDLGAHEWPAAADRVPTLTEVVELDSVFPSTQVPVDETGLDLPPADDERSSAVDLGAEVLFELEQRIDSLLEARLRDALAPALARAADGLIREARDELAKALRGLVDEAVNRALERRGPR
jgi:hypothetical protein